MAKETLSKFNAKYASTIINTKNPEWGTWAIILDESEDKFHEIRGDSGTKVLNEGEFKFWDIETYKEGTPNAPTYETAYRAYYWSSMSPDRRAESTVAGFRQDMEDMREQIKAIPNMEESWAGEFKRFNAKALDLYNKLLGCSSRCASTMVTGPANFNVRRNNKNLNYEQNARERYLYFINNTIAKLTKKYKTVYTREEELDNYRVKLEKLQENQELMKAANKILRSKKTDEAEKVDQMIAAGWSEKNAMVLLEKTVTSYSDKKGFAGFELSNNNAKIKATQARIEVLEAKYNSTNKYMHQSDELTVEANYELDRIMFFFDGKPEEDVRSAMKRGAYNWSRKNGAWQRKITNNALRASKDLLEKVKEML